jgi:hypothetical protein
MNEFHRYERAPKEVAAIAARLINEHYADTLSVLKPKIDFCFVRAQRDEAGTPKGPAITHNGKPRAGEARVVKQKDRALGRGDLEVLLDADTWETLDEAQKAALIDHELYHFNAKRKPGTSETGPLGFDHDDMGRPLFKLREHDFDFGWFVEIAARHGAASFEVQQAVAIKQQHGQLLFDFNLSVVQPELKAAVGM